MKGQLDESILRATRRCLTDLGFSLDHPALEDHEALLEGLWEFREHLGGRLTITFIESSDDPWTCMRSISPPCDRLSSKFVEHR